MAFCFNVYEKCEGLSNYYDDFDKIWGALLRRPRSWESSRRIYSDAPEHLTDVMQRQQKQDADVGDRLGRRRRLTPTTTVTT